jgi:predicted RNase H-like nuclease (RuvC/YqgF family)
MLPENEVDKIIDICECLPENREYRIENKRLQECIRDLRTELEKIHALNGKLYIKLHNRDRTLRVLKNKNARLTTVIRGGKYARKKLIEEIITLRHELASERGQLD